MTEILFLAKSATRRKLLSFLFEHSAEEFYLRDLARRIGASAGNLRRELLRLKAEALVMERKEAHLCYYRINRNHPLRAELDGIIRKTSGLRGRLAAVLSKERSIEAAFLYGSFAKESETGESDIDLLIVGDMPRKKETILERRLLDLEKTFAREINASVFGVRDFAAKAKDPSSYVREVVRGKKIFLVGDDEKLRALVR